jgi:hypothetical protein
LKGNQAQGRIGFWRASNGKPEQRTRWWSNASRARYLSTHLSGGVADGLSWPGSDAGRSSVQTSVWSSGRCCEEASPSLWRLRPPRGTSHRLSSMCADRQQCRSGRPRDLVSRMSSVRRHRERDACIVSPVERRDINAFDGTDSSVSLSSAGGPADCLRTLSFAADVSSTSFRARLILSARATGLTREVERLIHKPRIGNHSVRSPACRGVKGVG